MQTQPSQATKLPHQNDAGPSGKVLKPNGATTMTNTKIFFDRAANFTGAVSLLTGLIFGAGLFIVQSI